jgi:hypothetical protein
MHLPTSFGLAKQRFPEKCQVVAGAFLVLGLVAASSSIYLATQLAALSDAQDINIHILREHETRLMVNEHSIALINSTVLRMGKKVES